MVQTISIKTEYGETIYGNAWFTEQKLVGNIMVVHGMAEHSLRYDRFARYLNTLGYNVLAVDEVAHGKNVTEPTKPLRQYGQWPLDGFELCVEQVHALNKYIRTLNNEKIIVFGHSMGSFVSQAYYQKYNEEIDGVILCGSSGNSFTLRLSRFVTMVLRPFMSNNARLKPAHFLANVQANSFNKGVPAKFEDGYTSVNRWISKNEDNVKAYDADEGCGFTCSFNFYYSLSKNLQRIFKKKNVAKIKHIVPLLIISGAEDPVGGNGKYVKKLANVYGLFSQEVYCELYKDMKHEILNEKDYLKVHDDIGQFLTKGIK